MTIYPNSRENLGFYCCSCGNILFRTFPPPYFQIFLPKMQGRAERRKWLWDLVVLNKNHAWKSDYNWTCYLGCIMSIISLANCQFSLEKQCIWLVLTALHTDVFSCLWVSRSLFYQIVYSLEGYLILSCIFFSHMKWSGLFLIERRKAQIGNFCLKMVAFVTHFS